MVELLLHRRAPAIRKAPEPTTGDRPSKFELKLKQEANERRHQIIQYDPDLTVAAVIARFMSDTELKQHHVHHIKTLLPFFGDKLVTSGSIATWPMNTASGENGRRPSRTPP